MKILLAIALSSVIAAPAAAFDELFGGVDIGYAQAQEAIRLQKLEQARQRRAQGPRTKAIGDFFNPSRVAKQDVACMFAAVGRRAGAAPSADMKRPDVYHASVTLLTDYRDWYYAEFGTESTPKTIATTYMPRQNVIFLDDEAKTYDSKRTADDVLAGQFALYYKNRGMNIDAAETERWFNETYTSKNRSSCQ